MADIGTAYIRIAPNMSGIQGKIASGLKGSGGAFTDQFAGEVSAKSSVIMGAVAGIAASAASKGMSLISSSISDAIKRVDTLNAAQKTFSYMGFAADDAKTATTDLTKSIQGLPTPLDGAMRGMTALAATYGDVKTGQKVFSALNDAILGFGGTADMVDGAVQQLSQLPMDGPLDAQTWNSLRNSGLTPVMVAMAKDMGISVGQMKDDFGSGKLTVQDFTNELTKMDSKGGGGLTSLQSIAANATSGIGTGFANMQTSITRGLASIIQTIGQKNISSAIATIGSAFEKALKGIATGITFVEQHKDIFAPIAVGIATIVTAMTAWVAITKVITIAQTIFNAVMAMNPIGLIVIAIAGLVAGLVYFFTQTKTGQAIFQAFGKILGDVWSSIQTGFSAVVGFFTSAWSTITTGLAAVGNFFKGIFDAIGGAVSAFLSFFSDHWRIIIAIVLGPLGLLIDFVTAYWSEITGAISTALGFIWGIITGVFNSVVGFIGGVFSFIGNIISTAVNFYWGIISSVFGAISGFMGAVFGPPIAAIVGAFQWLGGIIGGIIGGIWNGITGAFNSVLGFLGGVGGKIMGIFSGAGSWLLQTGKDIINGLINGASSLLSKIGNMFLDIIPGWIKEPFKKALGIHSPSTVFAGFGDNITQGLINGVVNNASGVTDAVGVITNAAMTPLTSSIDPSVAINGGVPAAVGQGSGSNTTQTVTIGTVVLGTPEAAKEFFNQLNQDRINVSMGLTPNQGAV
jgi:tape measure domain-containing protein